MRFYSFSIVFLLLGLWWSNHQPQPSVSRSPADFSSEASCAYPNGRPVAAAHPISEGKCTGSAYCNICSNCSRCGYCSSGGSCGVCAVAPARSEYRPSRSSSRTNTSNSGSTNRSSNGTTPSYYAPAPEVQVTELPAVAMVSSARLNVREGPGTDYAVTGQLSAGDAVTVVETAGGSWVKIEYEVVEQTEVETREGYVFKKYLSF